MPFKTKLIIAYVILIMLLASLSSIIFTKHLSNLYKDNAENNIRVKCEKMSNQLDELVRHMELFSANLIADFDVIFDTQTLGNADRTTVAGKAYVNNAKKRLQKKLLLYTIKKHFMRVTIFNDHGDVITSVYDKPNEQVYHPGVNDVYDIAYKRSGSSVLIPMQEDIWAKNNPDMVFGLVRYVRNTFTKTYIEVYRRKSELDEVFGKEPYEGIRVLALTDYDKIFYTNIEDPTLLKRCKELLQIKKEGEPVLIKDNPTKSEYLATDFYSDFTGVRMLVIGDTYFFMNSLNDITSIILIMAIIIVIVSALYVFYISNRLTRPITMLINQIESTHLSNIDDVFIAKKTYDEFELLSKSFSNLVTRLKASITNENNLMILNAQANFESLQSQVNPHFLFNTLNLISSKGMEHEDEELCDICDCLAAMLSYTTNTKMSTATINDEIAHVENYIYLLKMRYTYKLEYSINVEETIFSQRIPKVVLQQFVENCFNHAFIQQSGKMRIDIRGWQKDGWWYVSVKDNGVGFDKDKINALHKKFDNIRNDMLIYHKKPESFIGGLGLSNTCARMVLMFNEDFILEIKNNDTGACVLIGAVMKGKRDRYD